MFGDWTPLGSTPPTLADLIAGVPVAVTPTPATAWGAGYYVVTQDGQNAYWDGAAWVASGPATGAGSDG